MADERGISYSLGTGEFVRSLRIVEGSLYLRDFCSEDHIITKLHKRMGNGVQNNHCINFALVHTATARIWCFRVFPPLHYCALSAFQSLYS